MLKEHSMRPGSIARAKLRLSKRAMKSRFRGRELNMRVL